MTLTHNALYDAFKYRASMTHGLKTFSISRATKHIHGWPCLCAHEQCQRRIPSARRMASAWNAKYPGT